MQNLKKIYLGITLIMRGVTGKPDKHLRRTALEQFSMF